MHKFVLESDVENGWVEESADDDAGELRVVKALCLARDSSDGVQLRYRIRCTENNEIVWEGY